MRTATDLIRSMVREVVDERGSQAAAEKHLGLRRSTLSRFVRGQGLTSEALDRLVEALGLEAVAAELQDEQWRRENKAR